MSKVQASVRATPAMVRAGVAALLPFLSEVEGWVDVFSASEAVIEAALTRSPCVSSRTVRDGGKG